MPNPQWVPSNTPPPQQPAPVGMYAVQNSDGVSIDIMAQVSGGGAPILIGTIGNATKTFSRAVVSAVQAQQIGINLDVNGKIITV